MCEIEANKKYQNIKTGKVVIVRRVSRDAYENRDTKPGFPEHHVVFNGTRDGKRFGATHSTSVSKFQAAYQPDERDSEWLS